MLWTIGWNWMKEDSMWMKFEMWLTIENGWMSKAMKVEVDENQVPFGEIKQDVKLGKI